MHFGVVGVSFVNLADLRVRNVVRMSQVGNLPNNNSVVLAGVEESVCMRIQEHDIGEAVFHPIVSFALRDVKDVEFDKLIKAPNSNSAIGTG